MFFEDFDPDSVYVDVPDDNISETEEISSDIDEEELLRLCDRTFPDNGDNVRFRSNNQDTNDVSTFSNLNTDIDAEGLLANFEPLDDRPRPIEPIPSTSGLTKS